MASPKPQQAIVEAAQILHSSAYVATGTGIIGCIGRAGWATFNAKPMVFHGVSGGVYGFLLGGSFWTSRCVMDDVLRQWQVTREHDYGRDMISSTVSGMIAGGAVNSINGRAAIRPAALIFGMIGLVGQGLHTAMSVESESPNADRPLLDRLSEKKWWPMKKMSDAEYEAHLTEKLVAVEAQLEILDERLNTLKQQASLPVAEK